MIEVGGRIHRTNPDEYLTAMDVLQGFMFDAYIYSKNGKYWVDDADYSIKVTKNDIIEAFTVLKQLYDSGAAQPLGETRLFASLQEQNPHWQNDQLGFILGWSGTIEKYKDALKPGNFAVGKPPFAEGGNQLIQTKPSMVLALSGRSPHVTTAADFANWLLNDSEATKILGTQRSVPTNKRAFDLLNNTNAIGAEVAAMVAFTNANPASPPPLLATNSEIASIFSDISEQMIFGRISPEAAADKFITDMSVKLNTLKGQNR
jgi:oligogalacturonide transport system substrate-binding protein